MPALFFGDVVEVGLAVAAPVVAATNRVAAADVAAVDVSDSPSIAIQIPFSNDSIAKYMSA